MPSSMPAACAKCLLCLQSVFSCLQIVGGCLQSVCGVCKMLAFLFCSLTSFSVCLIRFFLCASFFFVFLCLLRSSLCANFSGCLLNSFLFAYFGFCLLRYICFVSWVPFCMLISLFVCPVPSFWVRGGGWFRIDFFCGILRPLTFGYRWSKTAWELEFHFLKISKKSLRWRLILSVGLLAQLQFNWVWVAYRERYVVTLTRSMVLECVNFKGLQDSLRFPVLLAKRPPEPNWSPRMPEIEARTHQTAPYWGNAASKCYLHASDTLLIAAWAKIIAKTRTTTPPFCKKSNMGFFTHLTLDAARVPQTHASDRIK